MEYGDSVSLEALSRAQITQFFSKNAPLTQHSCNQEAERLIHRPVHPADIQGASSYTVVSNDDTCIVQFRLSSSALNMDFIKSVEQAYNGFIPHHEFIDNYDKLLVYKMNNVGGRSMYLARKELHQSDPPLLRQTVSDFARYVDVYLAKWEQWLTLTFPDSLHRHGIIRLRKCNIGIATN